MSTQKTNPKRNAHSGKKRKAPPNNKEKAPPNDAAKKKDTPPRVSTTVRPKRGGAKGPKIAPPQLEGRKRLPRNQNATSAKRKPPSAASKEELVQEEDDARHHPSPAKSTRSKKPKGSPNIESDCGNV
jgi:hypothetical protein